MLHLLPENEQKETYGKFVYESGRAAFEIGYWLLDSKNASKVDESKVTCPVLVVAGAEDRITPRRSFARWQENTGVQPIKNSRIMPTGSWPSLDGRMSQSISAAGSPNSGPIDVLSLLGGVFFF